MAEKKCSMTTKAGERCKAQPMKGKSRCLFHSKTRSTNWMLSRKTRKRR